MTSREFARQVQAAAGTQISLAVVESILNAADTIRDLYSVPCDECQTRTTDPTFCHHGRTQCPDCVEHLECKACAREALAEASGR